MRYYHAHRVVIIGLIGVVAMLGGCQPLPTLKPIAAYDDAGKREVMDCYARGRAAGASAQGPSVVWQMAAQNATERDVYAACMLSKGLNPYR